MEQVLELAEKLMGSLDANDSQTLQQSMSSVGKRLSHVLAASNRAQQLLETKTTQWHSFQVQRSS
jgi:hypothetical protein